jgi:anti-sigma-K factor RskA
VKTSADPRAEELLIERSLRPLDDQEQAELDRLGAGGDGSFDAAAAAIVLATTPIEPMPDHITAQILAAAPKPDFTRTIPGVVAMPPTGATLPRDTIVGVDLAAFEPQPQQQPQYAPQPPPPTHVDELAARRAQAATAPRRRSSVLPWLAAAASLLVASGAVWMLLRKDAPTTVATAAVPATARTELLASAGDAAKLAWTATPDPNARGASGDVVWSQTQQRGFMRFVGLAPNDPAQFQYQLWIFDKDRDEKFPVDGGVFNVSSTGEVIVPISAKLHVTDATLFAVTIEKPGGVVVSKRERIVVTAARS